MCKLRIRRPPAAVRSNATRSCRPARARAIPAVLSETVEDGIAVALLYSRFRIVYALPA